MRKLTTTSRSVWERLKENWRGTTTTNAKNQPRDFPWHQSPQVETASLLRWLPRLYFEVQSVSVCTVHHSFVWMRETVQCHHLQWCWGSGETLPESKYSVVRRTSWYTKTVLIATIKNKGTFWNLVWESWTCIWPYNGLRWPTDEQVNGLRNLNNGS